tara:strand:+ start:109 stop:366 length:258 start_codon:yes stop_codon:yes gene_type:complete
MIVSNRRLQEYERRAPGFEEACRAIAEFLPAGIRIHPEDFDRLRKDFGLSRGLGDTIEKATKAIGLRACRGCRKRRDKLNGFFPY